MTRYWRILFYAILFSFIWGTWWGFYSLDKAHPHFKGIEMRVLAKKNFFSEKFLADFEQKNAVRLKVTEKRTDVELLRAILSDYGNFDLIQFPSFLAKSFLIQNIFTPVNMSKVPRFKDISIDFLNLDFDSENQYIIPLSWGLTGFVVNTQNISLQTESLSEIMGHSKQLSLLDSPVEFLNLATKLKPIIKTWVETGQNDQLAKELKELKKTFTNISADPREDIKAGRLQIAQLSQGQVAKFVGANPQYRFVLPKERGVLWLSLMGVSLGARDSDESFQVLNALLKSDINRRLVEGNEQASVLKTLNDSDLPLLQKAHFIREVPLSRVELYINHEALEPIWMQAIRTEWKEFN